MFRSFRSPCSDRPVVAHVVDSLDGGGTERTLCALLRAFDPERLTHVVLTLREAGEAVATLPDHVACRPISASGRSWFAGRVLARAARSYGVTLIHARNTGCWVDAMMARSLMPGVRLALGYHGLEQSGPMPGRVRRRVRWGSVAGATFVSVSEAGRRQLEQEGHAASARIVVIPNGVEAERFGRQPADRVRALRRSLGVDESSFVVGAVGSLTLVKGHDVLLAAFKDVVAKQSSARLLVVGDGPLLGALEAAGRRLAISDRVIWAGQREDVADLLAMMDVFVCSSRSEGMSNAVLEAMAAGRPVVATDVGDNALLVRDGVEGRIVPAENAALLGSVIAELAEKPSLRRRFGEAGLRRARFYDFGATVSAYERFYESLCAGRGVEGSVARAASDFCVPPVGSKAAKVL